MADPNLELLRGMAIAIGPLCEQVVFVGGCATGLLVTQPLVADSRVRGFIAGQFTALLQVPDFSNALPGIVSHSSRAGLVLQRFADMAQL